MSVLNGDITPDAAAPPKALPFAEDRAAFVPMWLTALQTRFRDLRRVAVGTFVWETCFLVLTVVVFYLPHPAAGMEIFLTAAAGLGGAMMMAVVHLHWFRWVDRHTLPPKPPGKRPARPLTERIMVFACDGALVAGLVVVMAVLVPVMVINDGRLPMFDPDRKVDLPTAGLIVLLVASMMAWFVHFGTVIGFWTDCWFGRRLLRQLSLDEVADRLLAVEARLEPLDRQFDRWASPEVAEAIEQFSAARTAAADRFEKDFAAVEADLDRIDREVQAEAERLVLDPDVGGPRKLIALSRLREIVRYDRSRLDRLRAWCGPPSKLASIPAADPPGPRALTTP